MSDPKPLFTIGVTTFDRKEMLQECVHSILAQTFTDFEVIVSNDNPKRKLTKKFLGISDKRVRIVNQPKNLGEMANMNWMLNQAKGKYFTWLADDDAYYPAYLTEITKMMKKFGQLSVYFTSYNSGEKFSKSDDKSKKVTPVIISGDNLISGYLAKKIKIIGCYGMFQTSYIKELGGIQKLGTGFGPYSDNLIVLKTSSLKKIAYLNKPLIFFRFHDQSLSSASSNVEAYLTAQKDFTTKSLEFLKLSDKVQNTDLNKYNLFVWMILDYKEVLKRVSGSLLIHKIKYLLWIVPGIMATKNFRHIVNLSLLLGQKIVWNKNLR